MHAAAVMTDSGGVQREAAWLRVPCLVLRGTTEWVEAVADSGGRMVVVGLDGDKAVDGAGRARAAGSGARHWHGRAPPPSTSHPPARPRRSWPPWKRP